MAVMTKKEALSPCRVSVDIPPALDRAIGHASLDLDVYRKEFIVKALEDAIVAHERTPRFRSNLDPSPRPKYVPSQ